MALLLNVIVLIMEILYYSLFMKFARKEGNLVRYIIAFTIVTLLTGIFDIQTIFAYIVIVTSMLLSLKYIVKLKTSLYDLLFIFIMIFVKLTIEVAFFIIFNELLNTFIFYISFQLLKIVITISLRHVINKLYSALKVKWDNNNFYIRYIFTVFMFLYVISAIIYLIIFYS